MRNSTHIGILYCTIILLLIFIFTIKCESKYGDTPGFVETIEKKGDFHIKPKEVISNHEFSLQLKDTLLKYSKPADTIVIKKYINAPDTKKTEMFIESIGERQYKDSLENDDIIINYDITTEGTLKDFNIDYTIKPFNVEVPKPKKTVFAMHAGGGVEFTKSLEKIEYYGTLGFENKKGNILNLKYSTDNTIGVGYTFKIFDIKK